MRAVNEFSRTRVGETERGGGEIEEKGSIMMAEDLILKIKYEAVRLQVIRDSTEETGYTPLLVLTSRSIFIFFEIRS